MLRTAVALAIALTSTVASADTTKDVTKALETIMSGSADVDSKVGVPRFAVTGTLVVASTANIEAARTGLPDIAKAKKAVVGISADKTAAWINADVAEFAVCGEGDCYKTPEAWGHVTALFEVKGPKIVAWQFADSVTGKDQAAAIAKGVNLSAVDDLADRGTEDVVKLFNDTMPDPKKLAATVSDRKDAVMYGSELAERYVGGAKIKAQLAKWNLGFTVVGGVQAGLTKSGTVAFVAANVDAKGIKNPKITSPYRVFAVYEKTITSWKLVSLHFAFTSS